MPFGHFIRTDQVLLVGALLQVAAAELYCPCRHPQMITMLASMLRGNCQDGLGVRDQQVLVDQSACTA